MCCALVSQQGNDVQLASTSTKHEHPISSRWVRHQLPEAHASHDVIPSGARNPTQSLSTTPSKLRVPDSDWEIPHFVRDDGRHWSFKFGVFPDVGFGIWSLRIRRNFLRKSC